MLLKRVVEVPGSVAEDLKKRTANIGEPAEPAK